MKKNYFKLLFFWGIGISLLQAQTVTETFENELNDEAVSFSEGGVTFNFSSSVDTYDVNNFGDNLGWSGTAPDDQYLDLFIDAVEANDGSQLTIETNDGADFTIKSFWIYLAQRDAVTDGSGTLSIIGKRNGVNQFTVNKTSGFESVTGSPTTNNGFTLIDFSSEGGTDNSNTNIDELDISTTGNFDYVALDAFTFNQIAAPATTFTALADLCIDAGVQLNQGGGLPTGGVYSGPGVTDNGNGMTYSFDPAVAGASTHSITYTANSDPATDDVVVNALDDASFTYSTVSSCTSGTDITATVTGLAGGTFSSTAGLSLNTSTGLIDVSASTANTYTVTYTTSGTCPNSATQMVTINALDDASFTYSTVSSCTDGTDITATVTGLAGGTFSSTAGLSLNTSTGLIDVSASTANTYIVTYTTSGTCPNSTTQMVTINALDDASFTYSTVSSCTSGTDITATVTGLAGGTFSSTAGLSLNTSTGLIDVSASTANTYTVTYTTSGTCPNSTTQIVTINALDDASFTYNTELYFTAEADPTPTITGLSGGTFSSGTGIEISDSTGVIDLSESTVGSYMITYTTSGTCPNSTMVSIQINESNNVPSFDLPSSPNQTVNEDAGAQSVNVFATNIEDNNTSVQTLTFNVSNDNNSLFSDQPSIDASGNLTYTTAANAFGTTTVSVSLSDNGGTMNGGSDTSADQTFTISINQVNDTPVIITSISEDTGVSVADYITNDNILTILGTAEPNSIITFTVDSNPIPSFIASALTNASGVFSFANPGELADSTASFVASATLNGVTLNSAPQNVTVDTANPTVAISTTAGDPTDTNPIPMIANFSQEVNGFTEGDITVGNGSVEASSLSTLDNIVYTFSVVPQAIGIVTVDINASIATDIAGNNNEAAAQFSINFDTTLSNNVFSFSNESKIEIVNPVQDQLIILGAEVTSIEIYSLNGTLVATSIEVSGLASGVYIAIIATENKVITKKIIKE